MDYHQMVLRITHESGKDLPWFFNTVFYWKHKYHSDVSNDIVLFVQMKAIPDYIKDFFDEMEKRRGQ